MVHEQKFKVTHAMIAQKGECWTWNQRSMDSILTGGNIFYWHLLECIEASDANNGIIANSSKTVLVECTSRAKCRTC